MTLYRTTYTVVVLSDEPIPEHASLAELDYETTEGRYVLGNYPKWPDRTVETLTPEQMQEALIESASSPDFFDLEGGLDDGCHQTDSEVTR